MPTRWYNLVPDLPMPPPPPLNPATLLPLVAEDLESIFPVCPSAQRTTPYHNMR